MSLRDLGYYLRGRVNLGVTRLRTSRRAPPAQPAPLAEVLAGPDEPLALARLLAGRANEAREAAVAAYLESRGVPFARQRFAGFEGRGENFAVDLPGRGAALVLIAHHDAVPGSPGANDNAAAVGILLHLLQRWRTAGPGGRRVRLLFTACEELGYLGARAWVRERGVAEVAGVLSLELCGIGDTLAVWDAAEATPFLGRVRGALEDLGLRADADYHVVGRIPVFGSDHRAFAAAGVPGYGLTVVPVAHAEALRRFVFSPLRTAWRHVVRRPPPFDTYHTPRDRLETLEAAAVRRAAHALAAIAAG